MALLSLKASKKVEIIVKVEESTGRLVDRYAAFMKVPADDVVNGALEYIFAHNKEFQKHIDATGDATVPPALKFKKPVVSASPAKSAAKRASNTAPHTTA